jgi:hypothetical protein
LEKLTGAFTGDRCCAPHLSTLKRPFCSSYGQHCVAYNGMRLNIVLEMLDWSFLYVGITHKGGWCLVFTVFHRLERLRFCR